MGRNAGAKARGLHPTHNGRNVGAVSRMSAFEKPWAIARITKKGGLRRFTLIYGPAVRNPRYFF